MASSEPPHLAWGQYCRKWVKVVTPLEFLILSLIAARPDMKPSEIARVGCWREQSIYQKLCQLHKKGLVKRTKARYSIPGLE